MTNALSIINPTNLRIALTSFFQPLSSPASHKIVPPSSPF